MLEWLTALTKFPELVRHAPLGLDSLERLASTCESLADRLAHDIFASARHSREATLGQAIQILAAAAEEFRVEADRRTVERATKDLAKIASVIDNLSRWQAAGGKSDHLPNYVDASTPDLVRNAASGLRSLARDRKSVRRLVLTYGLIFAGAGFGLHASYRAWDRRSIEASRSLAIDRARTRYSLASLSSVNRPYSQHIKERGREDTVVNVVDRSFRLFKFEGGAIYMRSSPRVLPDAKAAKLWLEEYLAESPRLLVITGRFGSGIGYMSGHLFEQLKNSGIEKDPHSLSLAGHKRWIFAVEMRELEHFSPTDPGAQLSAYLCKKARAALAPHSVEDREILENAIVFFTGFPAKQLQTYLHSFVTTLSDSAYKATVVIFPALDVLTRWPRSDFEEGMRIEFAEYREDEAKATEIAQSVVRQRLWQAKRGRPDPAVVSRIAKVLLSNPVSRALTVHNWRISDFYSKRWFDKFPNLQPSRPMSIADIKDLANASLKDAIQSFANEWLKDQVNLLVPPVAVDDLAQLARAVIARADRANVTDPEVSSMVDAHLKRSDPTAPLHARRIRTEMITQALKGSPFFRADFDGQLTWQPFLKGVSNHLQTS